MTIERFFGWPQFGRFAADDEAARRARLAALAEREKIQRAARVLVAAHFKRAAVDPNDDFRDDLGADDIDMIELVIEAERLRIHRQGAARSAAKWGRRVTLRTLPDDLGAAVIVIGPEGAALARKPTLGAEAIPLTPTCDQAEFVRIATGVIRGEARLRTDPLTLNTLALGVLVLAYFLNPPTTEATENAADRA